MEIATTPTNAVITYEVGRTYWTRPIGDADQIIRITVVSRTANYVTIEGDTAQSENRTCRVTVRDGVESIRPWGVYSMAPVSTADRVEIVEIVDPIEIVDVEITEETEDDDPAVAIVESIEDLCSDLANANAVEEARMIRRTLDRIYLSWAAGDIRR